MMALRYRFRQISFLHVYHHSRYNRPMSSSMSWRMCVIVLHTFIDTGVWLFCCSIFVVWWYVVRYCPGGESKASSTYWRRRVVHYWFSNQLHHYIYILTYIHHNRCLHHRLLHLCIEFVCACDHVWILLLECRLWKTHFHHQTDMDST